MSRGGDGEEGKACLWKGPHLLCGASQGGSEHAECLSKVAPWREET